MKIFATWFALLALALSCGAADASLQKKLALLKKMDAIVIPELNFRQAVLPDVVQFLNDVSANAPNNVNIVLMDAGTAGPVTLSLKNVTLRQALKLIAETTGLEVYVEDAAVFLRKPKKVTQPAAPKSP